MSPEECRQKIVELLNNTDDKGYIRNRESTTLELKENFNLNNLPTYLKALASFANNIGGILLFGIKDSPRIPLGINKDKFDNINQERISSFIAEYFSPLMDWGVDSISHGDKTFGYFFVKQSLDKPIICKKTKDSTLREGSIYYRYRAQSAQIKYPELKKIHEEIKHQERSLWMQHIESIARIGPQHVALIDLFQGEVKTISNKFIIQSELLEELKNDVGFIKEGQFSETEGKPVLKVVGEVETTDTIIGAALNPDKDYPYFTKSIANEFEISTPHATALIWKLNFKGNRKYHFESKSSASTTTHKYSKYAIEEIRQTLSEHTEDKQEYLKNVYKQFCNKDFADLLY